MVWISLSHAEAVFKQPDHKRGHAFQKAEVTTLLVTNHSDTAWGGGALKARDPQETWPLTPYKSEQDRPAVRQEDIFPTDNQTSLVSDMLFSVCYGLVLVVWTSCSEVVASTTTSEQPLLPTNIWLAQLFLQQQTYFHVWRNQRCVTALANRLVWVYVIMF